MHLDPDEVLNAKEVAEVMVSAAIDIDLKTGAMLARAMETKDSAVTILDKWRGWAGHEAVAASLWCFLQHPDDYEAAVLLAVNSPGDSDSLGAITGALVGANVGLSGIPEHWVAQVEDSAGLRELGERICECLGV
jgi:ADP-ribosylglycohydrolase